ncbi:MAG: SulP family inorganic anion transporter [Methyloligellaceae bacterium]
MTGANFRTLKGDIYGGITAAVVALPLALAFGVASGAGAIAGLYGAIAVGFFAAIFGGTPAQVSGPTGPMTVVMGAIVAQYADRLSEAFAIVVLGGALQILFGVLRLGRYVSYTPYSVVSGFMSGIGVIIILIQTLPFFGLPTAPGGPIGAIQAWPSIPGKLNFDAVIIAAVALALMIFWPKRLHAILPPPLAALVIGTLLGVFALTGAPVIGEVPTGLPQFIIPVFDPANIPSIVQAALILALLGSIDSLLTSLVADSITRTRHDSNRELVGQGIGNMIAGLIGGLPGAGATMRTVVNVRAGGRTPVSGALHAVILLALVLGLGPLAEQVPHAALAGILLKVGWDIIDWGYLRRIARAPRDKVAVMLVTLGLTVFVDLITAVAVGIIMASFVTARWQEEHQIRGITTLALPNGDGKGLLSKQEEELLAKANGNIAVVMMRGAFSYASAREMERVIANEAAGRMAVVYDFSDAAYMDTSAALSFEELFHRASEEGALCFVCGLSGQARKTLEGLGILAAIPKDQLFDKRTDAVAAAVKAIQDKNARADEPGRKS